MRFPQHARLPALACAIGLAAAYALSAAWPIRYVATARVMLPAEAVKLDLLHFTPTDAVMALALSNAGGAKRWAHLLEIADEIAAYRRENPGAKVGKIDAHLARKIGRGRRGYSARSFRRKLPRI